MILSLRIHYVFLSCAELLIYYTLLYNAMLYCNGVWEAKRVANEYRCLDCWETLRSSWPYHLARLCWCISVGCRRTQNSAWGSAVTHIYAASAPNVAHTLVSCTNPWCLDTSHMSRTAESKAEPTKNIKVHQIGTPEEQLHVKSCVHTHTSWKICINVISAITLKSNYST